MSRNQNYRKGVGQYRQYKVSHASNPSAPITNPNQNQPHSSENSNTSATSPSLLEQIRAEWRQKNINTEQIDKLEGVWNALQNDVGRTQITNIINRIKSILEKIPIREVMNLMSTNDKLNDLLKNLSSDENSSDLLQNMLKDPTLRNTAMDMMQDIMSDENKLAEMTELMAKMLNPDKK